MEEIIGVRFNSAGKAYYFDPCGMKLSVGTMVIVETARGVEMGLSLIHISNRRAKDITVSFSDGSEMKFTLQDIFDQHSYYYQPIDFGTVKYTTYIRIRIDSIYPGSKWDDMCFSEIVPY